MVEKLHTPADVADILQMPVNTVLNFLRAKKLPGIKIGREWRIPDNDLQSYIDGLKAQRNGNSEEKLRLRVKSSKRGRR